MIGSAGGGGGTGAARGGGGGGGGVNARFFSGGSPRFLVDSLLFSVMTMRENGSQIWAVFESLKWVGLKRKIVNLLIFGSAFTRRLSGLPSIAALEKYQKVIAIL